MSPFHRCISGSLTDYPDYQDFEVKIFAGSKYADILTPDSTGPYFESIRQEFSLVAADSIDSSVVAVGIKVEPIEEYATSVVPGGVAPGKKSGIKTVKTLRRKSRLKSTAAVSSGGSRKSVSFIEGNYGIAWVKIRSAVKIEIDVTAADSVLAPLGDGDNINNPNQKKEGPDKRRKIINWKKRKTTEVTVKVMDNTHSPVPDYPFTLMALVRQYSGGHYHTSNRPSGQFITPSGDTVAVLQGTTDSRGKATYTYISSGIGGVDSIFVKGKTDEDTASTTILLRFSGLNELTTGQHYVLTGTFGDPGVTSKHRRNHYGAIKLVDKLKQLADTIYSLQKRMIRINDMSVIYGGPFDINNDWDTPHQTHRQGVSADISNRVRKSDGRLLRLTEDQIKKWLRFVLKEPNVVNEGTHFHITIR